jgi:hypothetical protein
MDGRDRGEKAMGMRRMTREAATAALERQAAQGRLNAREMLVYRTRDARGELEAVRSRVMAELRAKAEGLIPPTKEEGRTCDRH